jgi:hypothetical protein
MKLVIQCAGSKRAGAATLADSSGEPVCFVAHPERYSGQGKAHHPDGASDEAGVSWREVLQQYNSSGGNPRGLCRAAELYAPSEYMSLVRKFGWESVFILSAGWGLIRSDWLTPVYDITFKRLPDRPWAIRKWNDRFDDWNQLRGNVGDEVICFFGGEDYLPLFHELVRGLPGRKVIFRRNGSPLSLSGLESISYWTDRSTNWHYGCAQDFTLDPELRSGGFAKPGG